MFHDIFFLASKCNLFYVTTEMTGHISLDAIVKYRKKSKGCDWDTVHAEENILSSKQYKFKRRNIFKNALDILCRF